MVPFLEFALTALLIELTPGPNMAYLASLSLTEGRRIGLAAVAGVALGLALNGLLAVFGLAALVDASPLAQTILRYAGAGFLLYLAWDAWRGADVEDDAATGGGTAFRRALVTNLLNPKAAAFYITVMPLFLPQGLASGLGLSLAHVAIYVTIATLVHATLVLFADRVRPYLVTGRNVQWIRRLFALALAGIALWFFWETRR